MAQGALQVAADRLLHDHAGEFAGLVRIGDQSGRLQLFDADGDQGRRDRQIKHPAAGDAELLVDGVQPLFQLLISLGIAEGTFHEEQGAGEVFPVQVIERLPRIMGDTVLGPVANISVGIPLDRAIGLHPKPDHGEICRQRAVHVQVINGREQFPPREVARGAEDDQCARLRQQRLGRAVGQGIGRFGRHKVPREAIARKSFPSPSPSPDSRPRDQPPAARSTWPPNSFLMADMSLSA